MSGGIAYVYDPQGRLPENLNAEMVDLEEPGDDDIEWLRGILGAHRDATDRLWRGRSWPTGHERQGNS